jgi:rhodanese-related sulfurtransferase
MLNQSNRLIMKTNKLWMLAILFLAFFAVSCEDDEDPINEAQLLVEYLESAQGGNYAATAMAAIKTAEHVKTLNTAGTNYIIDIRAADAYAAGHVANAVNVAASDVFTHLEGTTADDDKDEIHIICYSGQSAAWATSLLRIAGYDNVFSMKWGMCSWHADFAGSWNNNTSNMYSSQFVDGNVEKGAVGELPVINTGKTTGEEILMVRVAEMFEAGFGATGAGAAEVFGALDNYYVANYWAEADYTHYGHIPGAMQYTPKTSMALDTELKTLPANETVVVYCWTGQTSANMAVYLRTIGYDAKTLKFGANGMIYDDLEAHKWSVGAIFNYEYVAPAPAK